MQHLSDNHKHGIWSACHYRIKRKNIRPNSKGHNNNNSSTNSKKKKRHATNDYKTEITQELFKVENNNKKTKKKEENKIETETEQF